MMRKTCWPGRRNGEQGTVTCVLPDANVPGAHASMSGAMANGRLLVVVGPDVNGTCTERSYMPAANSPGAFNSGGVNCREESEVAEGAIVCWMPRSELLSTTPVALARWSPCTVTCCPRMAAGCPRGGITAMMLGKGDRSGSTVIWRSSTGSGATAGCCGSINTTDT